jgi:hypothetical protein
MNAAFTHVYPDVDSAAVVWPEPTEGSGSWDDINILKLCKDARNVLNSNESDAYKLGYLKGVIYCIKETVKAKAEV